MEGILEGLLYVQGDLGITLEQICDILEIDENKAKELVYSLKISYEQNNRGLRINYLGNTIKLTTKEEHKDYYKKLVENPKTNLLSQSSLETLAIIVYNEPITRNQIEEYRGVDCAYIIRRLCARGFIKESGKADIPGRPILYKTTDEFLDYFGLSSKDDLPKIDINEEIVEDSDEDLFKSIYKEDNE